MKVDRRFSESCTSLLALFRLHQNQRMKLERDQVNTIILVLGSHVAMARALEEVKAERDERREIARDMDAIEQVVDLTDACGRAVAGNGADINFNNMRAAVARAPASNVVPLRRKDGGA